MCSDEDEQASSGDTAPESRATISGTVRCHQDDDDEYVDRKKNHHGHDDARVLNLMMICCEENAPYGPAVDTATLFLELLCAAYERHQSNNGISTCFTSGDGDEEEEEEEDEEEDNSCTESEESNNKRQFNFTIRITIYHAQRMDYPQSAQEWDSYDGIIIPGSFSSACDTHIDWIHRLMMVIQQEIHGKQRKTMGVCFGHQCFAHSFGIVSERSNRSNCQESASDNNDRKRESAAQKGGLAAKCCNGPMAGRKSLPLTDEGKHLFGRLPLLCGKNVSIQKKQVGAEQPPKETLDMLYTRGDMVQSLPSMGITLCGDSDLPNEACAYFASEEDAQHFQNYAKHHHQREDTVIPGDCYNSSRKDAPSDVNDNALPYAITFQAHPEFMTPTGYKVSFVNTVKAMEEHGSSLLSHEASQKSYEDASLHYEKLKSDCLDATISVGKILRWF